MDRRSVLGVVICAMGVFSEDCSLGQNCLPQWSDRFTSSKLNMLVFDLAVFDDGSGSGPAVYAGGLFTHAGDDPVNYVARLDGNRWVSLGEGLDNAAWALAACQTCPDSGPALYVGGQFNQAGGLPAANIARWDGTAWSALGSGVAAKTFSSVAAVVITEDAPGGGPALFVGGYFETAGGSPAANVAKWDGETWSPLGSGVGAPVEALAIFDDGSGGGPELYAAGWFTTAGDLEVSNIAKWNGESWRPVGSGLDDWVGELAVYDDGGGPVLAAGGGFAMAGGAPAAAIAKWDGRAWAPLGAGVDGYVSDLFVLDREDSAQELYATGDFTLAGDVAANWIARWDGASWSALGGGLGWIGTAVAAKEEPAGASVYAGYIGGDVDRWDGHVWVPLGNGVSDAVRVLEAVDGGEQESTLYVGGDFSSAGGISANSIAKWNGSDWAPLGSGVNGLVHSLAVFDDGSTGGNALYVGGDFAIAGGINANSIARWDGFEWSPLSGGVNGTVFALVAFDDGAGEGPALYAGGDFTQAVGRPASGIARWNGQAWLPVGDGFPGGTIYAMTAFGDPTDGGPWLHAGGMFDLSGSRGVFRGLGRWDGAAWSSVGTLWDNGGSILALRVFDDGAGPALYAGGSFCAEIGDDIAACDVAKWDGSRWSSIIDSISPHSGYVHALAVYDDGTGGGPALYAGGWFLSINSAVSQDIAAWNGKEWSPLAQGIEDHHDGIVRALAAFDDGTCGGPSLIAGGGFTSVGGSDSQNLAAWGGCAAGVPADLDGSGAVDVLDLLQLLAAWGPCPAPCPPECVGDVDEDCVAGLADLEVLLDSWTP